MTSLYNCRHSGDEYRISKFDSHFDLESSYLCTEVECECPAGHRPICRHRDMLPKFLNRQAVGTTWFFDYDRGGWVSGPAASDESPAKSIAPAGLDSDPAPHESPNTIDEDEVEIIEPSAIMGDGLPHLAGVYARDITPAPQAPTTPAQEDSDLLGNLGKSNQRLIAEAQPLAMYSGPNAPDLASEASALGVPATVAPTGTIRRRI